MSTFIIVFVIYASSMAMAVAVNGQPQISEYSLISKSLNSPALSSSGVQAGKSISTQCSEDVVAMVDGTFPNYGLLLDAWGTTTTDAGKFDQCVTYGGNHCFLSVPAIVNTSWYVTFVVCAPHSCNASDVAALSPSLGALLPLASKFDLGGAFAICGAHEVTWDQLRQSQRAGGVIAVLVAMILSIVLIVVGSFVDWHHKKTTLPDSEEFISLAAHQAAGGSATKLVKSSSSSSSSSPLNSSSSSSSTVLSILSSSDSSAHLQSGLMSPNAAPSASTTSLLSPNSSSQDAFSSPSLRANTTRFHYHRVSASEGGGGGAYSPQHDLSEETSSLSVVVSVLRCFSIQRNARALFAMTSDFSTSSSASISSSFASSSIDSSMHFNVFDGVRTLSLIWIVFGHTFFFAQYVGFRNPFKIADPTNGVLFHSAAFQLVVQAVLAVDTFFYLSGFLAAHSLTKRLTKMHAVAFAQAAPLGVLLRFLRLTPAYMFVLFFAWKIVPLLTSGPFWGLYQDALSPCEHSWQWNLLYVNNILPWGQTSVDQCLGWSWYLSNDMQFSLLLATPLIYMLARHRVAGIVLNLTMIVGSCVGAYIVGNEFRISVVQGNSLSNQTGDQYDLFYVKPWFRAPPYLIGLLVYFMVSHSRRSLLASHEHTRCFRWSLALVSATCMSLAVLLPFDFYRAAPTPWSQHAQSVWLALQRPLFTVGVALLCWLCTAGLGGWVGKFLGSRYWAPLSRLSYCGYLIHPVIMFYWYFSQQQYFDFSIPWYAMNFLGFLSMTFVAAAVLHLTVEAPVSNLVKLIWP